MKCNNNYGTKVVKKRKKIFLFGIDTDKCIS